MSEPIEFYFDFSSPYAYFAAHKIDELIEGFDRTVVWKPMLIGAAMKQSGAQPLAHIPMKSDYAKNDWERLARFQELPWKLADEFPFAALSPSRAFYWIHDRSPEKAKAFAWDCLSTFFGHGNSIAKPDEVAAIAEKQGYDPEAVVAALGEQEVKDRVKTETQAAIDKGVFGSPFFIVDGEPFWGADRLWMVKRWLRSGGW